MTTRTTERALGRDDGQTMAEFAMILGGVFLLVAATALVVGGAVNQLLQQAVNAF